MKERVFLQERSKSLYIRSFVLGYVRIVICLTFTRRNFLLNHINLYWGVVGCHILFFFFGWAVGL